MWKLVLLISCFILIKCNSSKSIQKEDYIVIKFMDFNSMTLVSVSCDNLDNWENLDSIIINKKDSINEVVTLLGKFRPIRLSNIDCRGKIEMHISTDIQTYCFDNSGNFANSKGFYSNELLYKFLKHLIKQ